MPDQFPGEWVPYQPDRNRDKEFYDIKLRDGTVVFCCYPNGVHWNHMHPSAPPPRGCNRPIADYRVEAIRRCQHPMDIGDDSPDSDTGNYANVDLTAVELRTLALLASGALPADAMSSEPLVSADRHYPLVGTISGRLMGKEVNTLEIDKSDESLTVSHPGKTALRQSSQGV